MNFSTKWSCAWRRKNVIGVEISFLNKDGHYEKQLKHYTEWIGVCTNNIDTVVRKIKKYFPGNDVTYIEITQLKKVLPSFEDRLARNKLEYRSKPFYKIYTTAPHKSVGRLFNCYKMVYYNPEDWLTRIYIDLCLKFNTYSFYYKWYEILNNSLDLMSSLSMTPNCFEEPDWTMAAFDIETVPLIGNHIPICHFSTDKIVMISLFKWNKRNGVQKQILYLLPNGAQPLTNYECATAFTSEAEMLAHFHSLLADVQIITGYNINAYDFPCIIAKLVWLKQYSTIRRYKSAKIGKDNVASFDGKFVIDLYTFTRVFSKADLPSYRLDAIAKMKLGGESKIKVATVGIWAWYRNELAAQLLEETQTEICYEMLKPYKVSDASEFGTFRTYLDYCLKDSELVYRLFQLETVFTFLLSRANIVALNTVESLHLGNSRFIEEVFKTHAICRGFLINTKYISLANDLKYQAAFRGKTYQGALNFCFPERYYEDVVIMDFASMYPSTLLSSNLCYGTCTIMNRDEWLANETAQKMTCIPYRIHSNDDFLEDRPMTDKFAYPTFNPEIDEYAIVINTKTEAFLPNFVSHFISLRKNHQIEYKRTKDIYHYNSQLGYKILINSLYGVMAGKDSTLAYLPIAMSIVTLSRYQLLGSYHYAKNLGFHVCYADTDSLMVHKWEKDNCDSINAFLDIPNVELKYEQRLRRLLVISKKRYIYESMDDPQPVTKGFEKHINEIGQYLKDEVITAVWDALFIHPEKMTPSVGWQLWARILQEVVYKCRNPRKYSIYRKVRRLEEYKSKSCAAVKFLNKYPGITEEFVEFTYSQADVAKKEISNWIMSAADCQWVDYEKLFIGQRKAFCILLNIAFWHLPEPLYPGYMVLNSLHWKRFNNAELLHWSRTGRRLILLTEPGVKYTFTKNDHLFKERKRGRAKKAVIESSNNRMDCEEVSNATSYSEITLDDSTNMDQTSDDELTNMDQTTDEDSIDEWLDTSYNERNSPDSDASYNELLYDSPRELSDDEYQSEEESD